MCNVWAYSYMDRKKRNERRACNMKVACGGKPTATIHLQRETKNWQRKTYN